MTGLIILLDIEMAQRSNQTAVAERLRKVFNCSQFSHINILSKTTAYYCGFGFCFVSFAFPGQISRHAIQRLMDDLLVSAHFWKNNDIS